MRRAKNRWLFPCGIALLSPILSFAVALISHAEDWPQWRGPRRDGVWRETGLLQSIPPEGLKVLWRVPVGTGFSSPVVVQERVYVTDSHVTRSNVHEYVRCFDAATGRTNWTHEYPVIYPEYGSDPAHPFGP